MTIRKSPHTQLPRRALSRAALAAVAVIVLACLATGCSPATSTASAHGTASSATPATPATPASTPASSPATSGSLAAAAPPASPTAPASTQPTGSAGTQEVLSPATVPPADKECTYPVTHTADGNAAPLLCQDGRLNVDAWDFYYASFASSELLRLGQGATAAAVYQAMCHDYSDLHMTKPEAESTEEIAQAYYGWNVSASALSLRLTNEGCPGS